MMELARFNTFFPPALVLAAGAPTPQPIARAPEGKPSRILIDNVGAAIVFISGTEQDAQIPGGSTSATFQLAVGASRVLVLSPGQVIYAVGAGAGSIITVSVTDAIPIGFERDENGQLRPAAVPSSGQTSQNPAWRKATGC